MEIRSDDRSWPRRDAFTCFQRPTGQKMELHVQPALASWDAKDHPSQKRLVRFLDDVVEVVRPVTPKQGPLAVSLSVGLPTGVDLLTHHDLDNYLDGLGRRVQPDRTVAFFGKKSIEPESSVVIAPAATHVVDDMHGWQFAGVHVSGSSQAIRWKEQIESAIAAQAEPAAGGALRMEVSFVLGPRRNWVGLWKPALDALGPILGMADGRRFNPRDDRIVELGLHRSVDGMLGNDVLIGYCWRPSSTDLGRVSGTASAGTRAWRRQEAPTSRIVAQRGDSRKEGSQVSPMMHEQANVTIFMHDDEGYLAWLDQNPNGWIINTTQSVSISYRKLHHRRCTLISKLQSGYSAWTTGQYIKICSKSRRALEEWSMNNGGVPLQTGCYCCNY